MALISKWVIFKNIYILFYIIYYFSFLNYSGPPRPGMQPQGPVGQPRGPPPGMVI